MTLQGSNRYSFHCEVVEIISRDDKRIINAMCDPGSMIIEIPDDGQVQLGDVMNVSVTINIDRIETDL